MTKRTSNDTTPIFIFLGFLLIAGVLAYGGTQGWFNILINVQSDLTYDPNDPNPTPVELTESCTLSLSPSTICAGEEVTGIVQDGINTMCYTFLYDGSSWNMIRNDLTDSTGELRGTAKIDVPGNYQMYVICDKDGNNAFNTGDCKTNTASVQVDTCTPPTPPPPDYNVGDIVGGAEFTGTMGDGVNLLIKPIDLGDFPATTDGGPYKLKARIQTEWDYINPDECAGIQGFESMHFSFADSERIVWDRTYATPVAIGEETECGLAWDGVTPWEFKANKVMGLYSCDISIGYKIDILVCE